MAYYCMVCGKRVNIKKEGVIIGGWNKVLCNRCLGQSVQELSD